MLAATLPGSCVTAVAFGSGPGGCAFDWDSRRLLGVCLFPLSQLQVCAGLSRVGLYRAPLASLPLVHASHARGVQSCHCGLTQASLGPVWCRWRMDLLPVPSGIAVPGMRCHSPATGPVCWGLRQLEE